MCTLTNVHVILWVLKSSKHQNFFLDFSVFHQLCPADLQEQLDRAMRLEEERKKVEQEAARLEAERIEAIIAKEELARQAEEQIKSQEQLVSVLKSFT